MAIATVEVPVSVPDGEADCGRCVGRLGAQLAGQPGLLAGSACLRAGCIGLASVDGKQRLTAGALFRSTDPRRL